QELLKAARSLKVSKRPAPEAAKPKEVFSSRTWKQIPRHLEGPDVEYLAKRRKGLITVTSKPQATSTGTTWNKATVRRTDAAGNMYVQDVVFAEGEQVEGEVISQSVIQDTSAVGAGTPSLAAAKVPPPRKRHPPPKRKAKGPGRGRKKKMAPTSVLQGNGEGGVTSEGATEAGDMKSDTQAGETPVKDEDTEMADDSDNEDGGDEEGEGEGEDEGEEAKDGDDSASPAVEKAASEPQDIPAPAPEVLNDTEMSDAAPIAPPPNLAEPVDSSDTKAGSPLKIVENAISQATEAATTSDNIVPKTEASPVPEANQAPASESAADVVAPIEEPAPAVAADPAPAIDEQSSKPESEQPEPVPAPVPVEAISGDAAPVVTAETQAVVEAEAPAPVEAPEAQVAEQPDSVAAEQVKTEEPEPEPEPEPAPAPAPAPEATEDFPDLLSGLEKKLEGDAEAVAQTSTETAPAPAEDTTKEE
ncbi:hypothetical protein DH86_00001277, partial [Scytalidium sp. 3C]